MKTHTFVTTRIIPLCIVLGCALSLLFIPSATLHAQAPADASLQTAMSGGLTATGLDPEVQAVIKAAVPPQYEVYVIGALLLVAAWCRFSTARGNGLSVPAAIGTIFNGTNTKKLPLILAGMCMLTLSSCATATAILASPFGRAAISTADQLAAQVVKTTEQVGLEQIIIQAGAKVAALKAQGVNADTVKETLRLSEIAGFTAVIEAAQDKYKSLTGARFSAPKNPVM